MYYPIDFEGDSSKHSLSLPLISTLLDRCLCENVLALETEALLRGKMGGAPVGRWLNTFFMNNRVIDRLNCDKKQKEEREVFRRNLLLRTAEKDYLEEEYEENAEFTLKDLIVELLTLLCPRDAPMSVETYNVLLGFFHKLLWTHIFDNGDNATAAGTIMGIMKVELI